MEKFTFIDLFAGIGGFRLALNNLGGKCINFSEVNKDAINTYCENYNEDASYNLGDITKIKELPYHDLLTGGVPCQSWSIAGKNLGFEDDRGQLWNDTIFLLNKSKPKAFIFENVKGLVDPRNKEAFDYILSQIRKAGYFVNYYLLSSSDYGVPQSRVRVFLIGFKEKQFSDKFTLPPIVEKQYLINYLDNKDKFIEEINLSVSQEERKFILSSNSGFNDYFLFNDLRNGDTTIHSWDLIDTTLKQKEICLLLLKNRRKKLYGSLDGNPLSLKHFQELDKSIQHKDLEDLVELKILKKKAYKFEINSYTNLNKESEKFLSLIDSKTFIIDEIKNNKILRKEKIKINEMIELLLSNNNISCIESRYDFKNTKISTGIFGINRVFLPNSYIFPTLVASDSNDYVSTIIIKADNIFDYKKEFIEKIYKGKNFRKITKEEACRIQGFPSNFKLPSHRAKWMRLIGNSVSVPVIELLGKSIIKTGVFD